MRRLHLVEGVAIKEIARRTGLARNSVRTALRSADPPSYRRPARPSKLDPFKEEVHRLLRADPRIPGQRIRELIAELGFDGGKTIVDDYLRGFKISRSIRSVWFSRRNRCNSSRSSLDSPPGRLPASLSACLTQLRNDTSEIPRSRATWRIDLPVRRTSSIASRLNSSGYGGLVLGT
jgi:transposase